MKGVVCVPLAAVVIGAPVAGASPYAVEVMSYDAGANPDGSIGDGSVALGEPERVTGDGTAFEGVVTPFNPAYLDEEVATVGAGGHLTVRFDHAVLDDALNPFGIDAIIFANEGFVDQDYPNGYTGDATLFRDSFGPAEAAARIEISQDNMTWHLVTVSILDLYPVLGTPGTDFTRPVDPSLTIDDFDDMHLPDIAAAYGGSGGGFGFDISSTGLGWFQYLRVSNDDPTLAAFEVDAFSDVSAVPAPSTLLAPLALSLVRRPRRRDRVCCEPLSA